MIKAITFDLDGVYFVNGKSNFIKALGGLDVSEREAKRVFLQSDEMNNLYKRGKMNDEEFWSWAAKEWKLNKSPDELIELLIDGYEINPDVVDAIKRVRENGYKTLICSNNFPARVNGLQKKFAFLKDFDTAVFSYEVGFMKPTPEIFSELIRRSGVKAEEIVYADDRQDVVEVAKGLGIQAFFYEDFDRFIEELRRLKVNI
ncbi:MAG: HAD family phosphatase [Parcubacteria group bacterium]|nr:HAD family phosphatase [Parcubacteria group bacterium]